MAKLTFIWRLTKWVSQNRRFVIIPGSVGSGHEHEFFVVDLDTYDDAYVASFDLATAWAEERAGAECLSS